MALPTLQQQQEVAALYAAFWNRAPDPTGFGEWVSDYANGLVSYAQMADVFRNSAEGIAAYPKFETSSEFVDQVYFNVFNRTPDAAGKAYWQGLLDDGVFTESQLVVQMISSATAQAAAGNPDGLRFDNVIDVALYVVTDYLSGNITADQAAVVTTNAFRYVTADASSIETSVLYINRIPVGEPEPLTVTQDVLYGTAGNDLFIGNLGAANANTLTLGDRLYGGWGDDRLDVTLGASVAANSFLVNEIEFVNISAAGTDVGITNAFAGVELIQMEDTSAYDVFVGGLTGQVDASLYNVAGANLTIESGASLAEQTLFLDTVDTATVTLENTAGGGVDVLNVVSFGGGAQDITLAGDVLNATELNIDAQAGISFAALDMANITDINILSAASADINLGHAGISLADAAAGTITVDALLAEGDVSLVLDNDGSVALYADFGAGDDTLDIQLNVAAGTSVVDVFMGAGDDTLTVDYTLPGNTNVSLDGGLGADDTLSLVGATAAASINTVDLNTFGVVQGFETLDFASGVELGTVAATVTLAGDIETVVFDTISYGTDASLSLVEAGDDLTVSMGTVALNGAAASASLDLTIDAAGAIVLDLNGDFTTVAGVSMANVWNFDNADSLTFDIATTGVAAGVTLDFTTGESAGTVYATFDAAELTDIVFTGGTSATFLDFDISGLTGSSDLGLLDTIDISGFAGTVEMNLQTADQADVFGTGDLTIVLGVGVADVTMATITGGTELANIYEFADDLEGIVVVTDFDNLNGSANSDQLDVSALGVTAFSQLTTTLVGTDTWSITSSAYDGEIVVTLENGGTLTAADFIFA